MKHVGLLWYGSPGEKIPLWQGVCWFDYQRNCHVTTIWGINVVFSATRWLWHKVMFGLNAQTSLDKAAMRLRKQGWMCPERVKSLEDSANKAWRENAKLKYKASRHDTIMEEFQIPKEQW